MTDFAYKYKNAYNKLCAFTLRNVHQYDKYVMRIVTCYCTLSDYIKLQRCEACILKCTASTEEKAFIVDEIVDLVCPEDEEIANNKDCSINHIPRDFVINGCNGKKQNSIKKARNYINSYIDINKFDITRYEEIMTEIFQKNKQRLLTCRSKNRNKMQAQEMQRKPHRGTS